MRLAWLKLVARASRRPILRVITILASGLIGALVILVAVAIWALEQRPDLGVWHEASLEAEFEADGSVRSWAEYRALEDRLFRELDEKVYAKVDPASPGSLNRYQRGSVCDPKRWPVDWNRTFEWEREAPRSAVLLLHGLSDSPYSLRAVGRRLHEEGAWVVGLRLPGHGTAPSGLTSITWEDWAAAVRLAARHLDEATGGRPLFIVGYSNGGALALEYATACLEDDSLPPPAGLVLISPAISVTPMAALAVWQDRLGRALGLQKLAWNSIEPEYDPFKYGSFAVNAGHQIHRLTSTIRARLEAGRDAGRLDALPSILAFQSAVDATVSTTALLRGLFDLVPPGGGHELVFFDINRRSDIEFLLRQDPRDVIEPLVVDAKPPVTLTAVTNRDEQSPEVVVRQWAEGRATEYPLPGLRWPEGHYSLSHIAMPMPTTDPLYGMEPEAPSPGISLGRLEFRGERDVLRISAADMLRLRSNPFFDYLGDRVVGFVEVHAPE